MGVVHLMHMTTDMEALRNEVLLLLIGLTHSNQSIQQIAAFEGAFERLLNIMRWPLTHTVILACACSIVICPSSQESNIDMCVAQWAIPCAAEAFGWKLSCDHLPLHCCLKKHQHASYCRRMQ